MFNSFFFFIAYQALIRLLYLYHNDISLLFLELTKNANVSFLIHRKKILYVICCIDAYGDSVSMIQKSSVLLNTSIR